MTPTVLAIDTAAPVVGLALVSEGRERCWTRRIVRGADAALAPALQDLLEEAAPTCIAATVGPGAFTSLRVGVATALGLALARALPVATLDALTARAAMVQSRADGRVLSLLDARKGRAYAAWYAGGPLPTRLDGPVDRPIEEVLAGAEPGFLAVGEGALRWREAIEEAGGTVVEAADSSPVLALARLALQGRLPLVRPEAVRVDYVRPPDAVPPGRSPR